MKKRKNKYTLLILIIFAIVMISISIVYAILSQKINITGKVTLREKQDTNKGYNVTYTIRNKWMVDNKYVFQISMTLENNTDELLDGWKISIENPENGEMLNYYNVNCSVNDKTIEFSNVSYNSQIPSKGQVTFEFQIATTNPYYKPGNIIINGSSNPEPEEPDNPSEPEEKKLDVKMEKENQWGSGNEIYTQIKVIVKNIGNTEIHSWQFDISFENETSIEQMWNVKIERINEKIYRISNSDYNGVIQTGSELSFGGIIKGSTIDNNFEIINISLK